MEDTYSPILRDVTQVDRLWKEEKIIGFTIDKEYLVFHASSLEYDRATIQSFIDECRIRGISFSTRWDEFGNWHFEITHDQA